MASNPAAIPFLRKSMKVILNSRPHILWIIILLFVSVSAYLFTFDDHNIKYISSGLMVLSGLAGLFLSLYYIGINYKITEDRLTYRKGIFNVTTQFIELYRVKDLELKEPFIYRFFGLSNIKVYSSDLDLPEFTIYAQKKSLESKLRKAVEAIRVKKGVREIDTV